MRAWRLLLLAPALSVAIDADDLVVPVGADGGKKVNPIIMEMDMDSMQLAVNRHRRAVVMMHSLQARAPY